MVVITSKLNSAVDALGIYIYYVLLHIIAITASAGPKSGMTRLIASNPIGLGGYPMLLQKRNRELLVIFEDQLGRI